MNLPSQVLTYQPYHLICWLCLKCFVTIVRKLCIYVYQHADFLQLSASAMTRLKNHGRSNVVYNLAKGVGTEQSDSCFPVCRMPMGLVEYVTNFFSATNINSVGKHVVSYILHVYIIITLIFQVPPCPQDYRSWLETIYVLPVWSEVG